jgi:hypothetical protein
MLFLAPAQQTVGVLAQLFPGLRNLELGYNIFSGNLVARNVLEQVLFVGKGGYAAWDSAGIGSRKKL